MSVAKELMLKLAAEAILKETGVNFDNGSAGLAILAKRLKGKSINELIAEIKEQG